MSKETTALMEPDVRTYRLPRTVIPEKYEIRLEPDLVNFSFAGEETVHIIISEPTQEIVLNALELEIKAVSIANNKGERFAGTVRLDEKLERAYFSFPERLDSGTWKLHIRFNGVLNDKLHGFYRSSYKHTQGQTKVLAATQFEATDARRAFPCWDEPDFKAVFRVTLIVDENLVAISNAQVWGETMLSDRGKKEVGFKDTIKMSTYLVAFIVGEFERTEVQVVDGTPIRIFTTPGKLHLAKFAQEAAAHSLAFFNSYYGLKYPADKLDLIAIPDFAFGAMENLGAVTFRETALLVDQRTASHAELERVADVVAHEIAHMWFGDLATMKWWNGIWLNEAFATFMQILAVDAWKPQWKRWETFSVSRAAAFATDGLRSTRAIEFPVRYPEEASAMFDVLTYEKGSSVLRMLEQYLGAEAYRRGISFYLAKHKYSNTETTDLWDAIEESCKQPVRQLMDTWIYQEGHPLVSVERGKESNSITLKQQRFLYLEEQGKSEAANSSQTLFSVPVMLRAMVDGQIVHAKVLLQEASMVVNFSAAPAWVVVNEGGHGFYRVSYSQELLQALTENLQQLEAIERFNLVNDTWASVIAGIRPLSEYLHLAKLFTEETDKNVWTVLLASMQYLEKVLGPDGRSVPATLSQFVRKVASPAQKRLGWEPHPGEDELTRQLRGMLVGTMGTLGDDHEVRAKAAELYETYKADHTSVSPDLAPALITILAHTGDEQRFNEFLQAFKNAGTPQEEERYMYSLAAFRQEDLLKETLKKTVDGEVRTQNAPYLLRSVMVNTVGRELAWEFMKENWPTLLKLFPEGSIPRMCEGLTHLVSEEWLKDARAFFSKNQVKQGKKLIDQHLEKLAVAVSMQKREMLTLKSF